MQTMHRIGAGLLAMTLAVGLAACGDTKDDEGAATTTTVDADTAAFCDGLLAFNEAVNGIELDETSTEADIKAAGETLAAPLADMVDAAPDDLAEATESLDQFVAPLATGDASAFNSDAGFAAYSKFVSDAVAACDFPTTAVDAVDYAFAGAPTTVKAGTVAFTLTNKSASGEDHEMVVFRKADGVTESVPELLALPEDQVGDKVTPVGAGFAPNGGAPGTVLATLEPGSYAMVCFIPVGGGEDGPPHFTKGMVHEFTVE